MIGELHKNNVITLVSISYPYYPHTQKKNLLNDGPAATNSYNLCPVSTLELAGRKKLNLHFTVSSDITYTIRLCHCRTPRVCMYTSLLLARPRRQQRRNYIQVPEDLVHPHRYR